MPRGQDTPLCPRPLLWLLEPGHPSAGSGAELSAEQRFMTVHPALPRSGLARRVINGLSSSTLGLQALSVPVHSRIWRGWVKGGSQCCPPGSTGIHTHSRPSPVLAASASVLTPWEGGVQLVASTFRMGTTASGLCGQGSGGAENTSPGQQPWALLCTRWTTRGSPCIS